VGSTMVLDSVVDIRYCTCFPYSRLIATTRTDLDSMLLSICPKDFWGSAPRKNAGSRLSFRVGYIVSSLIVPSYISVTLVATIVVVIAKGPS
jgi:hypothetical protein